MPAQLAAAWGQAKGPRTSVQFTVTLESTTVGQSPRGSVARFILSGSGEMERQFAWRRRLVIGAVAAGVAGFVVAGGCAPQGRRGGEARSASARRPLAQPPPPPPPRDPP